MVRRHIRSDFAADVFVFPGGKVDDADRDPQARSVCDEGSGDALTDGMRALRLAGIRELFEEAGVLIASREDGKVVEFGGADGSLFEDYRRSVQDGEMSIVDVARVEGLTIETHRLLPFSRWITPPISHRRFDTHFFLALAPEGQEPLHDARETTAGLWIGPRDALNRYHAGDFPLVFATEKHLERLAAFPTVEPLLASTAKADLTPVMPRPIEVDGEMQFLLPGDEGY